MSDLLLKLTRLAIATVLIVGSLVTQHVLRAEEAERVMLIKSHGHDLSVPTYDAAHSARRCRAKDMNLV